MPLPVSSRPSLALLSALVALQPLAFSLEGRAKALPVALLFLWSLVLLVRDGETRAGFRQARPVVGAALLLVAAMLLTVLLHGLEWRPLDAPAHILLFLAIAAAFAQPLDMRTVWLGFSLTAIGLGVVCVVQVHGIGIARAHGLNGGASASIQLATVLFGLALVALVRMLDAGTPRGERMLHGLAAASAMYGALLTQSRGPLLAFLPAFLVLALVQARRRGRWRNGALCLAFALGAGAVAMLGMHGQMLARFSAIPAEVASFEQAPGAPGAVRERLEMWQVATRAFLAHPLAGIGSGAFNGYVRGEVAAGRASASIAHYNQPHNEYLDAAASGGIAGLAGVLLAFALPLLFFLRRIGSADPEIAQPARAGFAITLLYALCALTDGVFYRVMTQSFYFFMVIGLAVRIGWCERRLAAGTH